jgi:hypothetical protein
MECHEQISVLECPNFGAPKTLGWCKYHSKSAMVAWMAYQQQAFWGGDVPQITTWFVHELLRSIGQTLTCQPVSLATPAPSMLICLPKRHN